ncbi:MAG: iron complex transport system substrate-binding protein [Candidatus Electronema aureum]|uniref:Iron complex transport system substrate-binding protein n=1 Tax=Candidatus Electronema aureum TaxID=2005002 RepID=A0A521G3Q2_9BACT|nr:MAG: iron complex transport system substrate-binding protein [Candidatus Electronema aureum]
MTQCVAKLAAAFALAAALAAGNAAAAGSRTLSDMNSRTVTVPETIRKVVPLSGALRFLVYMQSLDLVSGMERIEQRHTAAGRLYGLATRDLARKLPIVGEGGPGKLPDFERIIELGPDVIIVMGLDSSQIANIEQKTGIPVFSLNYGAPGVLDVQSTRTALGLLGQLLGRSGRSAQLIAEMDRLEADFARRTAGLETEDRQTAYVGAVSLKGVQGITSTDAAYAPLAWAGGKNVAAESGKSGHLFIDPEQLLAWNPAILFLDAASLTTIQEDSRKRADFYQRLQAVQKNQVYLVMPYNAYHTNIEIAYADTYFIGKTLYPYRFQDVDPAAKADEIFQAFIGLRGYEALKKEYGGFRQMEFGAQHGFR